MTTQLSALAKPKPLREDKKPLCFRSDERFLCTKTQCPLRKECMKLVAAWRR